MKTKQHIFSILSATLLIGCLQNQFDNDSNRIKDYEIKMTADWIKDNIVIGKTTEQEIKTIYGKPLNETSMAGVGVKNNLMPDKIITYAVTFSERTNNWQGSYVSRRTTRSVAFSLKNNLVINYTTSNN